MATNDHVSNLIFTKKYEEGHDVRNHAARDCAAWLPALVAGILASKLAGTVISHFVHPFRPRFSIAGGGLI